MSLVDRAIVWSHNGKWRADQIGVLEQGVADGLTDAEIAPKIGRTIAAVEYKRRRLRVYRPSEAWPAEVVSKLRELAAQGFSGGRIAKELGAIMGKGFTRNAIMGKCHREGIVLLSKLRFPTRTRGDQLYVPRGRPKIEKQFLKSTPKPRPQILSWKKSEVVPLGISLLDLQSDIQCHQVVDGETDDNCCPLYCGHPIFRRSYCFEHYRENHQTVRVNA